MSALLDEAEARLREGLAPDALGARRLTDAAGTALDRGAAIGAIAAAVLLAAGLCPLARATVRLEDEDAEGARRGAGPLAGSACCSRPPP